MSLREGELPDPERLRAEAERTDDPRRKLALQQNLVEALYDRDPEACTRTADEAIALAQSLGDEVALADLRLCRGRCRASLGLYDPNDFNLAYNAFLERGESGRAAAAAIAAGDAEARHQQYRAALAWYSKGLDIASQSGAEELSADALEHLGELYTTLHDYPKALDYYLQSLAICEERGDFGRIAHLLHSIGLVHGFEGNYDAAHDYLSRSLETFRETGDPYREVQVLKNQGDIHCARAEFDKALDCGLRAFTVYETLGDTAGMASALLTIGTIQASQRRLDVALHFHRQAMELLGEGGDKGLHITALLNIGRLYRETGDNEGARFVLEQGLAIAQAVGDRTGEYQIHGELSRVLENLEDYRGALEHHRLYLGMFQRQTGEEKQQSIAEVQMRFDLERALKDEEIRQRNNVMQAVVETQEVERQRIAGDLHDGLGQLLATVKINLLRIEDAVKGLNNDLQGAFTRAMRILDKACTDVRTLAHRMASTTLQELGIAAALAEMIGNIQAPDGVRFALDIHGVEGRMPEYVELGLYRIAQELINNILKHAAATNATIQLLRFEESVVMMVEDNGKGFEVTSPRHGGMGIRNIEIRVKILNGSVEFDSTPGHGTTVTVEIPLGPRSTDRHH